MIVGQFLLQDLGLLGPVIASVGGETVERVGVRRFDVGMVELPVVVEVCLLSCVRNALRSRLPAR